MHGRLRSYTGYIGDSYKSIVLFYDVLPAVQRRHNMKLRAGPASAVSSSIRPFVIPCGSALTTTERIQVLCTFRSFFCIPGTLLVLGVFLGSPPKPPMQWSVAVESALLCITFNHNRFNHNRPHLLSFTYLQPSSGGCDNHLLGCTYIFSTPYVIATPN